MYDSDRDCYADFTEFTLVFYLMADGTEEEVLSMIYRVFDMNTDIII